MPMPGERYWMPHKDLAFLPVLFKNVTGNVALFVDREENEFRFPASEAEAFGKVLDDQMEGVNNICTLQSVTQASVLNTVKVRYTRKQAPQVYTSVAQILIAVNPFQALPIYSHQIMSLYLAARDAQDLEPHIFTIGHYGVKGLSQAQGSGANQVVLISGESGAGKTESTKLVLSYVAEALGGGNGDTSIQEKIMRSNPILESFGNAMTVRNNNSSRFGKFIDMRVCQNGPQMTIAGCKIDDYLLEQTRVTKQGEKERNYHVFFQLLSSSEKLKATVPHMMEPNDYKYIKNSQYKAPGIDDVLTFEEHVAALDIFDFTKEEQTEIFKIVMAVLTLGNIEFADDGEGSKVKDDKPANDVASLLGIQAGTLKKLFTTRILLVGREKTETDRSVKDAEACRDSVARLTYSRLFKFIVKALNKALANGSSEQSRYFGILDIAGFESFEHNSIEQLFINLSNEHLQAHFNTHIFKMELEDYKAEEVEIGEGLTYQDNSDIISLIDSKVSVLATLDEEITVPKATDATFLAKSIKAFEKHIRFVKPKFANGSTFDIKHFAGQVTYDVTGWLSKNVDKPPDEIVDLFKSSELKMMQGIASLICAESDDPSQAKGGKKKMRTVSSGFRSSLVALIAKINQAEPHFIRCIKPNSQKVPNVFDPVMVMNQLNFSGVFEAVRIRQSGFANRVPFAEWVKNYRNVLPPEQVSKVHKMSPIEGVNCILKALPNILGCVGEYIPGDVVLGKSKVFSRSRVVTLMEKARDLAMVSYVMELQARIRGWLCRKNLAESRQVHQEINRWNEANQFYGDKCKRFESTAYFALKSPEAIDEQVRRLEPLLVKAKEVLIPLGEKKMKRLQKAQSRMKMEADCVRKLRALNTSVAPLECERMVIRAKELNLEDMREVKLVKLRVETLRIQLPLSEALKNILQDSECGYEEYQVLFAEISKHQLDIEPAKWLKELDSASLVEDLRLSIEKATPIIENSNECDEADPVALQTETENTVDALEVPTKKKKKKNKGSKRKPTNRGTITGQSAEKVSEILLKLLGAMETYDSTILNETLHQAIYHGIEDKSVLKDAEELFANMEREDFLHDKMMDFCDLIIAGAGNETANLLALKNLSDKAIRLNVAEGARIRAKKLRADKMRMRCRATIKGRLFAEGWEPDESMIDEAFNDLLQFPGLRHPESWKGHRTDRFARKALRGSDIMLRHCGKPLVQSLTKLYENQEKDALSCFINILGWMHDVSKTEVQRVNLIVEVTKTALKDVKLADEIYIMLMKQLTDNSSPRSVSAGWKLLLSLVQNACPSNELLEFLHVFFLKALLSRDLVEEKNTIQQCIAELNRTASPENSTVEVFPVQVSLMDESIRKIHCCLNTTIEQLGDMMREQLQVRQEMDWSMFQSTTGLENHRLLPTDATVATTLSKWNHFRGKTGKQSWFVFKRRFLKVKETLDPAYPNDAKLTFTQALQDYKVYPIGENIRFIAEIAGRILYLERDHFKGQIKNILDGNLTGEGILEQLVPERLVKDYTRRHLSAEILKVLANHPAENRYVTMGRCYQLFQKMKLFGVQWWAGKQVQDVEDIKLSIDDRKYFEANKHWVEKHAGDNKKAKPAHCIINPKSKSHMYVLAIDLWGIRFMSTTDKAENGVVFSRGFRFMEEHWERVLVWGGKANILQMLVTTVDPNDAGAGKVPMRLNFQTAAAVDICFVLHTMYFARGSDENLANMPPPPML